MGMGGTLGRGGESGGGVAAEFVGGVWASLFFLSLLAFWRDLSERERDKERKGEEEIVGIWRFGSPAIASEEEVGDPEEGAGK